MTAPGPQVGYVIVGVEIDGGIGLMSFFSPGLDDAQRALEHVAERQPDYVDRYVIGTVHMPQEVPQ